MMSIPSTQNTPANYLAHLPAWDQVPRLDAWLPHVLDAAPMNDGMLRMEYLSLVGRYWLLGMVARAMEPGCKFDCMPMLDGAPGTGKSTLLATLADPGFFCDTPLPSNGWRIDAPGALHNLWIWEFCELSALSRADRAALKTILSQVSDTYRPPYCADIKRTPRQFLIAGTASNATWLSKSKSRRFWLIPVPKAINTEWVRAHRDQLFAEALSRIHEFACSMDLSEHPGRPRVAPRGEKK